MKSQAYLLAAALTCAPGLASADEYWITDMGEAYYSEEMQGFAIFRVPWGDLEATFYFEGLAGNYDNRSLHEGYWIVPGMGDCPAALVGIDDQVSTDWGRVTLAFDRPAYPTGWTATLTTCFGQDPFLIRADLIDE